MQTAGVALPYWENAARLVENDLAFLLLAIVLTALLPLGPRVQRRPARPARLARPALGGRPRLWSERLTGSAQRQIALKNARNA